MTQDNPTGSPVQVEPKQPYWFRGNEPDEFLYCLECLMVRSDEAQENGEIDDPPELDGGFAPESDTPAFCETCGYMLQFVATDYCWQQELEHARDHGPSKDEIEHLTYCSSNPCVEEELFWLLREKEGP